MSENKGGRVEKGFLKILSDERVFFTVLAVFVFNLPFSEAVKEISLVLAFLLILVRLLVVGFSSLGRIFVLGFPVILFSFVSFISAIHSTHVFQAMRGFWGDFEAVMAWVVFSGAFLLFQDRMRTLRLLVKALAAGILAGGLVGLYKMGVLGTQNMEMLNLGDKNSTAQFLSMAFLFFLGVGVFGRETGLSWKWITPLLFMTGVFLVLCHSRTFLMSLPLASMVLLLIARRWKAFALMAGSLVLAGSAMSISSHLRWEMGTLIRPTRDGSFQSRYDTWKGALRMFHDRPLLGIGPDTFQLNDVHKIYHLQDYASHGHNIFFNILGEYGLLGVLSFASIIVLWIWRVLSDHDSSAFGHAEKGMTAAFLVNLLLAGVTHPMWGGSGSLIFMMTMALILVMVEDTRIRRLSTPAPEHPVPLFRPRNLH